MSQSQTTQPSDQPVAGRTFPHETRTAIQQAAFLLPFLSTSMSLLDIGCGPGTITTDLAEIVAPGAVVGLDNDRKRIESSIAYAAERAVGNVRFELGDAAALPLADGSLDAAYANTLLEHVPDPEAVVAEVFRVLKPGGVFGARDVDRNSRFCTNVTPQLTQATEVVHKWMEASGSNLDMGGQLYALLEQGGFAPIQVSASVDSYSTPEAVRRFAGIVTRILESDALADKATSIGWADRETLDRLAGTWTEWAEQPGSFYGVSCYEVIGWKPE